MGRKPRTGLDIATSCVRAAEVVEGDGQPVLRRFGQLPLPPGAVEGGQVRDPEAVGAAIKQLWKQGRFSARRVSIGMANQQVAVREVDTPWVPVGDRRRSLPLLVADQVPMPVDQAVLDLVPLHTTTGAEGPPLQHGLLVAAAEDAVMAAVAGAEAGGLQVGDVDLTAFALIRALVHADPLAVRHSTEAVIDVGAATTTVAIHVDGIPRFVRILDQGGDDVTAALTYGLGFSRVNAEALKRETALDERADPETPAAAMTDVALQLIEELRGSLDYFLATGASDHIERVILTGGGSLLHGFAERLTAVTGLPISRGRALTRLDTDTCGLEPDHLAFADPFAAAAVGLAIGGEA